MRAMVKILVLHAMAIQLLVVLRYRVPHRTWVSREKIALLGRSSRLADSLRLHDRVVGVVNWNSLGLHDGVVGVADCGHCAGFSCQLCIEEAGCSCCARELGAPQHVLEATVRRGSVDRQDKWIDFVDCIY